MAAAALAAAVAAAAPAQAQDAGDARAEEVRRQYLPIDRSVVRIRTVARLDGAAAGGQTAHASARREPLSVYGSGVVIGTLEVGGRREYLILTNHHVADASNYVIQDGASLRENKRNTRAVPTAEEESYVVREERDEVAPDDVKLIEIARHVRGDMALLRTVGARRELVPFTGAIGYRPGEVPRGATVVTSGFPYSGGKVLAVGQVLETDRFHELGQPHVDFTVDLPVERGQSGSPVFMVTERDGKTEFTLIGLLHALEGQDRFMVPFELWEESLEEVRGALEGRLPS